MLRPWHAIRPIRREVVRTRLHVPNVENERIRLFMLTHRISTSTSQNTAQSTFTTSTPQEKQYWDDTKLPPSPHLHPSDPSAPSLQDLESTTLPSPENKHKKTVLDADAEVLAKLESHSGEGGSAGVEYEGGKPVALKRAVKDNMFRVI